MTVFSICFVNGSSATTLMKRNTVLTNAMDTLVMIRSANGKRISASSV